MRKQRGGLVCRLCARKVQSELDRLHLTLLRGRMDVRRHLFPLFPSNSSLSCKKKKKINNRMNDEVHKQQKGVDGWTQIYSNTTVPPAASRAAFSFSASSLDTLARIS